MSESTNKRWIKCHCKSSSTTIENEIALITSNSLNACNNRALNSMRRKLELINMVNRVIIIIIILNFNLKMSHITKSQESVLIYY